MSAVESVECVAGRGLRGDRFWDYRTDYPGQITFFAEEVHGALLRELSPRPYSADAYRRNVITRGIDLSTLIGQEFTLQQVRFLGMAECKPCHWMNTAAAPGAETWLRGRGGLRAKILSDGLLRVDCPGAAGLLLAGGRARRMGVDKATLDWRGRPLGEQQAATLAGSGAWPLLVACRPDQPWTPVGFLRCEDRDPDGGAFGALVGGFAATDRPVLTVLAVDLPLVSSALLERMTGLSREHGVSIVPRHENRFHPFAAAWHRSALPMLRDALRDDRSLQDACAALEASGLLQAHALTADEAAQLANVNTPADLSRTRSGANRRS